MTRNLFATGLLLVAMATKLADAAVPRSLPPEVKGNLRLVKEALKLPLDNRIQALRAQGPNAARQIFAMINSRSETLEVRWRSLTVLPHLDKVLGHQAVEQALKGDEWYMRNAAVVALLALPRNYAVEASAKLLSDPALVVRTAAAQNLLRLGAHDKESLLWEKLNSPENFRNGESLWIRRHIARALAEMASNGSEARFVALLSDRDPRLHPFAIRGLERLTGQRFAKGKESLKDSRAKWLAWWSGQNSAR